MMKRCVCISLLFLSACSARHAGIEFITMVPPAYEETARYREISVMPFDGPRVEETADLIGRELAGVTYNGRNFFSVQDYRKLKDISPEDYDWMMNPPLNTDMYSRIGRMLGVQAVFTGEVTTASSVSDYDRSRSTECEEYDKNNICIKEKKIVKRCNEFGGKLVFTVRLIDVLLSRVVFTGRFSGASGEKDCSEEDVTGQSTKRRIAGEAVYHLVDALISGSPADVEQAHLDTAHRKAVQSFLNAVTPRSIIVRAELMDPGKDITSPEAREKISTGLEAARLNEIATACALFADAGRLEPAAPSLLYNLGACEEARGNPEEAQALYRRSGALSDKSAALIETALDRVEEQIRNRAILSRGR